MTKEEARGVIEAILFASSSPTSINEIASVLEDVPSALIKDIIYELKGEYESQKRSFTVTEIAGGFQLVAETYYAPWIKKLFGKDKGQRLSMPALETLAIIAYKQPITRSEIETIRGVNIDGIIENLLEKDLIKTGGRKEAPGRPFFYTTTDAFLVHFGLRSLNDLPQLKEFTERDIDTGEGDLIVDNITKNEKEGLANGTSETPKTN